MRPESTRLVRQTWAAVSPQRHRLADAFYARLFAIAPDVRQMFPTDMTAQHVKFTTMLDWIVVHLEDTGSLVSHVAELGKRHAGYGVLLEHYALVGDALIWGMAEVLGPEFPDEAWGAWREAYQLLAALMARGSGAHRVVDQ